LNNLLQICYGAELFWAKVEWTGPDIFDEMDGSDIFDKMLFEFEKNSLK